MTPRSSYASLIGKYTEGIVGNLVDVLLLTSYVILASPGRSNTYKLEQLTREAYEFIDEINYTKLKRAFYNMTQQRIIERARNHGDIRITELGKKRIATLFPIYLANRPWDNHVYLVSYDIPTRANSKRVILRDHLKKTGCALLQASLWISPYAPYDIITDFITKYSPGGTILVSKMGKHGAIGQERLEDLIARVYKLDELADRYHSFIQTYCQNIQSLQKTKLAVDYFAILRDDPQLPFPLEPKNFPGKQAHALFSSLLHQ